MSKIGKKLIELPQGVTVENKNGEATVSGPKGQVSLTVPTGIETKIEGGRLKVIFKKDEKGTTAVFGTTRARLANAVLGVSQGWSKQLELVGTGFRAEVNDKTLNLTIGYSHPVKIEAPEGISFKVEKSIVTVEGIDREVVGQVAAKIRAARPPEPYKGKGIKYIDEIIRRKAGKVAKAIGTA